MRILTIATMAFRAMNAFDVMTAEAPWNDET